MKIPNSTRAEFGKNLSPNPRAQITIFKASNIAALIIPQNIETIYIFLRKCIFVINRKFFDLKSKKKKMYTEKFQKTNIAVRNY